MVFQLYRSNYIKKTSRSFEIRYEEGFEVKGNFALKDPLKRLPTITQEMRHEFPLIYITN